MILRSFIKYDYDDDDDYDKVQTTPDHKVQFNQKVLCVCHLLNKLAQALIKLVKSADYVGKKLKTLFQDFLWNFVFYLYALSPTPCYTVMIIYRTPHMIYNI